MLRIKKLAISIMIVMGERPMLITHVSAIPPEIKKNKVPGSFLDGSIFILRKTHRTPEGPLENVSLLALPILERYSQQTLPSGKLTYC